MKKYIVASLLSISFSALAQTPIPEPTPIPVTPEPLPVTPTPTPVFVDPIEVIENFTISASIELRQLGRNQATFVLTNVSGDIPDECQELIEEDPLFFTYRTSFEPTFKFLQKAIRKGRTIEFEGTFQKFSFGPEEEFVSCHIDDFVL